MMSAKENPTWRDYDWSKSERPERERDYSSYRELVEVNGDVVGRVEEFARYPGIYYATIPGHRSGPRFTRESAEAWLLGILGLGGMLN